MHAGLKALFEWVPLSEHCSFALREFDLPAFASPWHFHPEFELTLVLEGRGSRFVGDRIAPYEPGDLVLLGSNLPHYWRSDMPGRAARARSVVVQFREDCLGPGFFARPELAGPRRLLEAAARGVQFTDQKPAASVLQGMPRRDGLGQVIDFLTVLKLLADSGGGRPLASPGYVPCLDARAGERINRACRRVLEQFAEPLRHQEIAKESGMSLPAFCREFKRVTGRTLTEFITDVRVGHARKLLIETGEGVAQIAYACGFESLSHFNRCFRGLTGASPREFRQNYSPG